MILSYQLGAAMLTVDGITLDELSGVLDVLTRRGATPAPDEAPVSDNTLAKALNGFLGVDPLDKVYDGPLDQVPLNDGPLAQPPEHTDEEVDPLDEFYGVTRSQPQERAAEAFRNGGHVERQHLDVPDLDDPDALARLAFEAFNTVHPERFGSWTLTATKPGWRAAAAAVKTAASLQQLNRAAAEV